DIVLGGEMDGIELAKALRHRSIPFIYVTSHTDQATLHRAKMTEPYGYIPKPFSEPALRANIELALYKCSAETHVLESLEKYAEEPAAQEEENGTVQMEPLQPLTVVVCDEPSPADNAEAQPAPVHETDFSFLGPAQGSGFLFRLEHYQVIKLIGKGSNGMVFEA